MFHFNPSPVPTNFYMATLLSTLVSVSFTKLLHQQEKTHDISWGSFQTSHGNEILKCKFS